MRNVVLACVLLAVGVTAQETVTFDAKPSTRVLPADVLRDVPDMCFGSTTYLYYPVGTTWNLELFCGRSTCMKNATGYFERVEDCGPPPKPNEQCVQKTIPPGTVFPACCPKYECQPGATLEYPTEAEIKAEVERRRLEHEAVRQAQGATGPAQPAPGPQA